ncbi:MAG TPA: hypothetical protein PLN69_01040 [bacterium]|nr:hypothetical protein [bacterium]
MDLISFNRHEVTSDRWSRQDRELALGLLKTDPLYSRIPENEIPGLIESALISGEKNAQKIAARFDCKDPLRIARMMNIRVIFDISRNYSRGGINILSTFIPNPATITVFENRLRICREKLAGVEDLDRVFLTNLTNICVAHELYHHIERKCLDFINLKCKVVVFNIKFVKLEKSLSMLSEIAANAFTSELLGLPVLPSVIHDKLLIGA